MGWEPLENRSPYPRIDLNPNRRTTASAANEGESKKHAARLAEGERIWQEIVKTSQGNG